MALKYDDTDKTIIVLFAEEGLDEWGEWDPEKDPHVTVNYSLSSLDKKYINKGVLQQENGLVLDRKVPLLAIVTRLADQKGLDILLPIMENIAAMNVQFVLLGTGEENYHDEFRTLGEKYPEKFGVNLLFDDAMARRIYAGADIFLMPSDYEPCGLGQIIALRYHVVPIVRQVGGLADTIRNFNIQTGEGNGFVFSDYSPEALLSCVERAVTCYQDKKVWKRIVENGTCDDFSWHHAAEEYVKVYCR